jgi:beta-mannosidase
MTNDEITDGESWIARRVFPLNEKWKFKEASDSSWLPVAQFPTNVHLDLLHHGKIPDPFLEQNETAVQWVGEKVWIYCTEFDVPRFMSAKQRMTLVLEGLDTFATVVLNGSEILRSNDMFIPKRVDVSNMINLDGNNTIEITFDSTWLIGKKLQEQYPDHFWGCWNGDCSRLAVRKAQYHYV